MKASPSEPLPAFDTLPALVPLPNGAEALNSFPAETPTVTASPEDVAPDFDWPLAADPDAWDFTGQHVRAEGPQVAPARRIPWPVLAVVATIVLGAGAWMATGIGLRGPSAIARTAQTGRIDSALTPLTARRLGTEFVLETPVRVPGESDGRRAAAAESAAVVTGAIASTAQRPAGPPVALLAPTIAGSVPASLPAARQIEYASAADNDESTPLPPTAVASGVSAAFALPVAAPTDAAPAPGPSAAPSASVESSSPGKALSDPPPASAAVTPATSVAAPAINGDEDALRRVLGRYRTAYSQLDASAVQAVWPTVDAKALARAFDQLQNQEVEFSCGLSIAEQQAVASCKGGTRYVPKVGNKSARYDERQWLFQLHKTGNVWTIQSVDSRR
jgi:hypothetical protein